MIRFSEHALLKLRHRHISRRRVEETIISPDYVAQGQSGRNIAYKKIEKLYLKVIFKKENGDIIVITQHWQEHIRSTTQK